MEVTFIESQPYYPKSNLQGESESMGEYQSWDKINSTTNTEPEPCSYIFQNPWVNTPTYKCSNTAFVKYLSKPTRSQ